MSEVWKVENQGPTSREVAMEAIDASACNRYVCTNKKTGEVRTVIACDTWDALKAIQDKERKLQAN